MGEYRFETDCVRGFKKEFDATGAVCVPIYQSATFAHPGPGKSAGYDYSRVQNPTREVLEKTAALLEGGTDAIAFSSGMAAIAALMELFAPGDGIVACGDIYGGTHRLFAHISRKNRISVTHTDDFERAVDENSKAIFVETPTNPLMRVYDLEKISQIAKKNNLLLIVDNTFLTPYFQKPIALGADIVVHSGTKYLGGHNDTLAGFLVSARSDIAERLRFIAKTTGACLAPFDSYLILRGIKTLALRMEKQQENALKIARWLKGRPEITEVHYPGLLEHPSYEISKKQTTGFGSMISFETKTAEFAIQILGRTRLITFAESLGGVESLITYPLTQTHSDIPETERLAVGITDRLLRLSIGIEAAEDLIADLEQAFR
jgi:cystathionine beta-lyase/cystathionine gamma-synthase